MAAGAGSRVAMSAAPIYAPALVGFYGGGSHVGVNVSIGIGNVGWFPLGPAEVYRRPMEPASTTCGR